MKKSNTDTNCSALNFTKNLYGLFLRYWYKLVTYFFEKKTMKKQKKQSKRQTYISSICLKCRYGNYYESNVVWFECCFPEFKCTETNKPIPADKYCDWYKEGI